MVFFGHNRCQEDVAESVNGLVGKVAPGEVELESASESLYSGC